VLEGLRLRVIVILSLCVAATTFADEVSLLHGLDTDDAHALSAAVAAIEHAPTTRELADVLFAAGRACEDRLYDPARALAIYERLVRELPDAGVSIAAARRISSLQAIAAHAREAAELAELRATADQLAAAEVIRRADALAHASWPGADDTALWLADWLCRTGRRADARTRYEPLVARNLAHALHHAAGCAIEARDWPLAERLAAQLPADDAIDRAIKDDLLSAAARGRFRERLYTASWLALALAALAMLASLVEAMSRGGWRAPRWRPPIEVMFLAPVAAVIVIASFTAHRAIAPAVTRISLVGVAFAWLSGTVLDLLRTRGRAVRARAVVHVLACVIGVLAIGYIAITRDGLLDLLAETVKFGPGA